MAKTQGLRSRLIEFSQRLLAESSSEDASQAAEVLDVNLDGLCAELGITSIGPDRYRALCVILFSEIRDLPELQLDNPEKGAGGAPVVWNLDRHASLVDFVNAQGCRRQLAIRRARDKFRIELPDPTLAYGTVRAEFYRAKRFFECVPHIATAMMLADTKISEQGKFADFIKDGVIAFTKYGKQPISATHIGKVKSTSQARASTP